MLAATSRPATARQGARRKHVLAYWGAWFAAGRPDPAAPARIPWLEEELARHGFRVGDDTRIEYAFTGWDTRHEIGDEARRLVTLGADVVWTRLDLNHEKRRAVAAIAPKLPIVMDYWDERLAVQEVGSLRRPRGQVTGVATNYGLLSEKRLELVRELLPTATRLAVVSNFADIESGFFAALDLAAGRVGLRLIRCDVARHGCLTAPDAARGTEALEATLADVLAARADAFMAFGGMACSPLRGQQFEAFELRHRIPYIHDGGSLGSAVGLGWDYVDHRNRAVAVVAKLLRGARPSDIPIEVTSRVLLTVNPKRAAEIGLAIPPAILLRADRLLR